MLKDLKISKKLAFGFSTLMILLALIGFLGYKVSNTLSDNIVVVSDDLYPKTTFATNIKGQLNVAEKAMRDIILSTNPEHIKQDTARISKAAVIISKNLDTLEKVCKSPEEKKILTDLVSIRKAYVAARTEILRLGLLNTSESNLKAAELLYSEFQVQSDAYYKSVDDLVALQDKLMVSTSNASIESAQSSQRLILIIGGLSLILGFIVQIFISKGIKNALTALRESIEKSINSALNGNLSFRSDVKTVPLEFQPLLTGMNNLVNAFVEPINVSAEYIDRISKGDLPPKITEDYKGDFNEIKVNLNQCIENITLIIGGVTRVTKSVQDGNLQDRLKQELFTGDWFKMTHGVNEIIGAFLRPINITADYIDRISKGDIPPKIAETFSGDFNELKNNINQCISAIGALVEDANMLSEAAINAKFATRADVNKHSGDFAKVINGVNNTLDIVVDKMVWYEAIIDATPFPIHVIDMDMNWTFLNKAFEKLMVDGKIVKDRNDAVGKPCCSAGANICNTDSCGIKQLHKGNGVSYFDWAGMQCKQDTSFMYNAKGEKIGYVEVVTDLTNILSLSEYNKVEVERLASNLNKLALGSFEFDFNIGKPSTYTKEAHENFLKIDKNLEKASLALQNITKIANEISKGNLDNEIILRSEEDQLMQALLTMTNSLNEFVDDMNNMSVQHDLGDIDVKMDLSKFNGSYKAMAEGVNKMVFGHIAVKKKAMACVAEFGNGNFDAPIERFPGKKVFINDTIEALRANLKKVNDEIKILINDSKEGRLQNRGDANKYEGDWKTLIGGINEMLDAILIPIGEGIRILKNLSGGDLRETVNMSLKGDHKAMQDAVNGVQAWLKGLIDYVTMIANGDMSANISKASDNDQIHHFLIQMRDNIKELVSDAKMLSQAAVEGQLSTRANADKHKGDFKAIVQGVNETLDAVVTPVSETLKVMKSMSNSDFTNHINGSYRGDFKELKDSLNLSLVEINNAFGDVLKTARGVENGSHQVADSSTSLSQGATEQAASLEEMTSSMSEVASQTKRNAENANVANNLALEARNSSDKGEQEMKQLMKAMDEINESSKGIAKIIKVIDEIAFQTNLLALNAAVEAARAGVHGQGFAVVAEEVRNLAARSAQAAKETAEMIEGSIKTVDKGSQISQKTQEALNEIKINVTKVNDIISEIAVSSNEQAQGIAQINLGLNQIDKVTQQNTATSEQSATAADELSSQSRRLTSLILKFKLSGSDSADYSNERSSMRGRSASRALPAANHYDDEFNIDLD